MARLKILAIGSHPDDIELGCGGALLKYASEGNEIYGLILTYGEEGYEEKRLNVRKQEAIESAKKINMELFFGELQDTRIMHSRETVTVIEKVVKQVKPDIIFTHSTKEVHQDHKNTAFSTFSAARDVKTILMYESPSSTHEFIPQYFVPLDSIIDKKVELLKIHASQNNKYFMEIEAIKGLAQFRGYQAKTKFAEAFEVFRIVE